MFFIFFVNTGIILESRYRMHEVGRDGAVLCGDGVRMEKICYGWDVNEADFHYCVTLQC